MIRFLNLKDQILEGSPDFAFWDTVSDTFCYFGPEGDQVFSSKEEFVRAYGKEQESMTRSLNRFLALIPDNFFNNDLKFKGGRPPFPIIDELDGALAGYTDEQKLKIWETAMPDMNNYIVGCDPYDRLNWIQRQFKKIGFYKNRPRMTGVLKWRKDGTVEFVKQKQ